MLIDARKEAGYLQKPCLLCIYTHTQYYAHTLCGAKQPAITNIMMVGNGDDDCRAVVSIMVRALVIVMASSLRACIHPWATHAGQVEHSTRICANGLLSSPPPLASLAFAPIAFVLVGFNVLTLFIVLCYKVKKEGTKNGGGGKEVRRKQANNT